MTFSEVISFVHLNFKKFGAYLITFVETLFQLFAKNSQGFGGWRKGILKTVWGGGLKKAHDIAAGTAELVEEDHFEKMGKRRHRYDKDKAARSVIKIGKQVNNIKQDFKGDVSPDRIAFSLVDHLKKVSASNPRGANAKTLNHRNKQTGAVTNI